MWDYCANSLDTARLRGATYADARVMDIRQRDISTKNGEVGTLGESESLGIGIRVIASGAWGFASTDRLTREGVARLRRAKPSPSPRPPRSRNTKTSRSPRRIVYVDTWQNPFLKDPFRIPVERQTRSAARRRQGNASRERRHARRRLACTFRRIEQLFRLQHRLRNSSGQNAFRRGNRRHQFCRETKFRSAPIPIASADSTCSGATN